MTTNNEHEQHMRKALQQAEVALKKQEVPIGCVFVVDNQVIASGSNMTNTTRNATRHAELEAVDEVLATYSKQFDWSRCSFIAGDQQCLLRLPK